MTNTPTNWTDGYGTVHAGPPPAGYWIASDDRWYAAELHPDYVPGVPDASEPPSPFAEGPTDPFLSTADAETPVLDPSDFTTESASFDHEIDHEIDHGLASENASGLPPHLPSGDPTEWDQPQAWDQPTPTVDHSEPDPPPTEGAAERPTSRRPLVAALVGVVALLGLIAAAYMLTNRGDDPGSVIAGRSSTTTVESMAPATPPGDAENATANDTESTTGVVTPVASNSAELEGIESCTRIDEKTLEISMVNVSEATASYLLTIAYLDAGGTRIGDDTIYISSLRPDEQTIEQAFVFSDAGVGCEVIEADRYDRDGAEGIGDISECSIREPNAYGSIEADVSATNSGSSNLDYTVEVALINAEGVRRGYGTAYIERARVGEATPGEVYTTVGFDESYRCEVVAVTRFESTQ